MSPVFSSYCLEPIKQDTEPSPVLLLSCSPVLLREKIVTFEFAKICRIRAKTLEMQGY